MELRPCVEFEPPEERESYENARNQADRGNCRVPCESAEFPHSSETITNTTIRLGRQTKRKRPHGYCSP